MAQEVDEEERIHNEELEREGLLGTSDEKSTEILVLLRSLNLLGDPRGSWTGAKTAMVQFL